MPGERDLDGDGVMEGRRLASLLGALVLIGGLIVLTGFIVIQGRGQSADGARGTAPAAGPVTASVVPPPNGEPASTEERGSDALPEAPGGVRWELYQGFAVPISQDYGPREVDGHQPATGYHHSPEGALLAASNLEARVFLAPDETWRDVVAATVVPGEGRDAWIAMREQVDVRAQPAGPGLNQLAGFRLRGYTDTVATFDLVSRNPSGELRAGQVTVNWVDDDWKLVLRPSGGTSDAPNPVDDLAGFVPWGGF